MISASRFLVRSNVASLFRRCYSSEFTFNFNTWATVDLLKIERNAKYFVEKGKKQGASVMAVIKADAYGHGALKVGNACLKAGVSHFAVARYLEAIWLRNANFNAPLLVFGHVPNYKIQAMLSSDVEMTVWDIEQVETIANVAKAIHLVAKVQINCNTGMMRVGVDNENELLALVERVQELENKGHIKLTGIYTHFACADSEDTTTTQNQLASFNQWLTRLPSNLNVPIHASNSAGSLTMNACGFDMMRVGIALYGLQPTPERNMLPNEIEPALSWYATVAQIRKVPKKGTGVSYSHVYKTQKDNEILVTLPVGYADGFRRTENNKVIILNKECDVVGRVTMDQIVVRLHDSISFDDVSVGTVATLIGQGRPASAVAKTWNTIDYEVTCGIAKRVTRIYSKEEAD